MYHPQDGPVPVIAKGSSDCLTAASTNRVNTMRSISISSCHLTEDATAKGGHALHGGITSSLGIDKKFQQTRLHGNRPMSMKPDMVNNRSRPVLRQRFWPRSGKQGWPETLEVRDSLHVVPLPAGGRKFINAHPQRFSISRSGYPRSMVRMAKVGDCPEVIGLLTAETKAWMPA